MKRILFAVLLALVPLASASMLPNETYEQYQQRWSNQTVQENYTCGNGICEGNEFETCKTDCELVAGTTTTTLLQDIRIGTVPISTYAAIAIVLFAIVVIYNLLKLRSKLSSYGRA